MAEDSLVLKLKRASMNPAETDGAARRPRRDRDEHRGRIIEDIGQLLAVPWSRVKRSEREPPLTRTAPFKQRPARDFYILPTRKP